ncbi:MAG: rod shape-determining protein [Oscillospiraceae bacterium]|nr:rod shape-determining protein [Candidatus Equicaccousia limihippi]
MPTDIVIDMGSKKTVLYSNNRVVLMQPSVVTVDAETFEPKFFGDKAQQTVGRTPDSLTPVFPIAHGVIADYEIAETMLKTYMAQVFGNRVVKPRAIITLPSGLTEMQHHSVSDVAESAGGRNASTIESPLASALALGIDFKKPKGAMIIDIGAGVTDIATISMGGISQCNTVGIAGNDFDESIVKYVKRKHKILIGPSTAEKIKMAIGSATRHDFEIALTAKGRQISSGLPTTFEMTSLEIYEAIKEHLAEILNAVKKVLQSTPPDIVGDIMKDGIYLTGGSAKLRGLDMFLENSLGAKVIVPEDPEFTAVKGAALALKTPEMLKNNDFFFRSVQKLKIDLE